MKNEIVLIHGTWASNICWDDFPEKLEAMGYTVHTPNLRFRDLSREEMRAQIGTVSLTDYVDDLCGYISRMETVPIVLGHSLGCLLAQLVAARVNVRGLILLGPAPAYGMFVPYLSMLRCFRGYFTRWGFWKKPFEAEYWMVTDYIANCRGKRFADDIYGSMVPDSGRAYMQMTMWLFDREKAAKVDYDAIRCPVLVVTGTGDRITVPAIAKKTARHYRNCTLSVLQNCDHMYMLGEQGDETAAQIAGWASRNGLL